MARPSETVCTVSNYADASGCFKALSSHERQALMVYLKVRELAGLGGTDYTAQLGNGGTLVEAAACIYQSLQGNLAYDLAKLVIQQDNTNSAGGATSTDIQTLAEAIKCLKDFDETTLKAMDLHVTCLLGRHAAYPQVNL